MNTTYTIAYLTKSSLLLAAVKDGEDVHAAVADQAENLGQGVGADDYTVVSGCTLTDDDTNGEVVFRNPHQAFGDLLGFDYAVKL